MRRLAIPDVSLIPPNQRLQSRMSDPDLEEVISVLSKDTYIRGKKEIERAANTLIKTGAFNKYVTDKLDKNHLVQVLAQSMKLEFFPKDSVILHFESREDKMVIMLRGQAKHFIPKTLDDMEKELRRRRKISSSSQFPDDDMNKSTSLPGFSISEKKGRRKTKIYEFSSGNKLQIPGAPAFAGGSQTNISASRETPNKELDTSLDKDLKSLNDIGANPIKSSPNIVLKSRESKRAKPSGSILLDLKLTEQTPRNRSRRSSKLGGFTKIIEEKSPKKEEGSPQKSDGSPKFDLNSSRTKDGSPKEDTSPKQDVLTNKEDSIKQDISPNQNDGSPKTEIDPMKASESESNRVEPLWKIDAIPRQDSGNVVRKDSENLRKILDSMRKDSGSDKKDTGRTNSDSSRKESERVRKDEESPPKTSAFAAAKLIIPVRSGHVNEPTQPAVSFNLDAKLNRANSEIPPEKVDKPIITLAIDPPKQRVDPKSLLINIPDSPNRSPVRSGTMVLPPTRALTRSKTGVYTRPADEQDSPTRLSPTKIRESPPKYPVFDPETGEEKSPPRSPTKRSRADIFKSFNKVRRVMPFIMKFNKIREEEEKPNDFFKLVKMSTRGNESDRWSMMESDYDEAIMKIFREFNHLYYQGILLKLKFDGLFYPGDCYGIRNLFVSAPTNRCVIAHTDCVCLTLDKELYERIMEREKSIVQHKLELFVRIFKDMEEEEHAIMFSHCWSTEIRYFGEYLYKEGDKSDCFYILGEGEVIIQKNLKEPKQHKDVPEELPFGLRNADERTKCMPLTKVVSGGFIGEEDYFEKRERTTSAKILTQEVVLFKMTVEREASLFGRFSEMFEEIHSKYKNKENWQKKRLNTLYEHYESDTVKQMKSLQAQPIADPSPTYVTFSIFKTIKEPQRLKIYITEAEKKNYLKRSSKSSTLKKTVEEKNFEKRDKELITFENEVKKDERDYINLKSGVPIKRKTVTSTLSKTTTEPSPLEYRKVLIKRIKATQLQVRPVLSDISIPSRAVSRRDDSIRSKNSPGRLASRLSQKSKLSIETEQLYNFEGEINSPLSNTLKSAPNKAPPSRHGGSQVSMPTSGNIRDSKTIPLVVTSGIPTGGTASPTGNTAPTIQTLHINATDDFTITQETVYTPISKLRKIDEELELTGRIDQKVIIRNTSFTPIHNNHTNKTPKSLTKQGIQPTVIKKPTSLLKPLTVKNESERKANKLQDLLRTQSSGFHRKALSINQSQPNIKKNRSTGMESDFF